MKRALSSTENALLRLVVMAPIFLIFTLQLAAPTARFFLPVYRAVYQHLMSEFLLRDMSITDEAADQVIRATVSIRQVLTVGARVLEPNPEGSANTSTLIAHILHCPLIALLTIFVWPCQVRNMYKRELTLRFMLLAPPLLLFTAIDIPVVLAGDMWEALFKMVGQPQDSWLVSVKSWLQGGGRWVVGLTFAFVSIHVSQRIIHARCAFVT